MIELIPFTKTNFKDFVGLIHQRGGAEEAFYRWKFMENPIQKYPWGYIAYKDGIAIGCMGCLSKIFIDDKSIPHTATWFVDWYVAPEYRGNHIGINLQKEIFNLSPFAYGITNPKAAQIIAKKTGYTLIPDCILSRGLLIVKINHTLTIKNRIKQYIKDQINKWCARQKKGLHLKCNEVRTGKEIILFFNDVINTGTFLKDAHYYDWLLKMPLPHISNWYLCSIQKISLLVRIDKDNKRCFMRVFESSYRPVGNKQYYEYLRILSSLSKYFNADSYESFDIVRGVKYDFRFSTIGKLQPMQYNSSQNTSMPKSLSIADKESSWTSILINS